MTSTRLFIDWLSATLPGMAGSIDAAMIAASEIIPGTAHKWTYAKPMHGYKHAARTIDGVTVMVGREDMGCHISIPGSALAAFPGGNLAPIMISQALVRQSANFARLDVAVDAADSSLDIHALRDAFVNGEAETGVKRHRLIESDEGGLTLYIGSPTSTRQLRVYNKAAERRHIGDIPTTDDWIRIELQLRDQHAHTACHMIAALSDVERIVRTLILQFIDFPTHELWTRIMRGPVAGIGPSYRKRGNVRKWLLSACAVALARELHIDPAFKAEFERSVRSALASLSSSSFSMLDNDEGR